MKPVWSPVIPYVIDHFVLTHKWFEWRGTFLEVRVMSITSLGKTLLYVLQSLALFVGVASAQTEIRDHYVFHNWSVSGTRLIDSYTGWQTPMETRYYPSVATIAGETVDVTVRVRYESASWAFTFITPAGRETTMMVPLSMDTAAYTRIDFNLLDGQRAVTLLAIPVNYPPPPYVDSAAMYRRISTLLGDSTALRDSLNEVLALLRWGIKAISFTDSNFWKFHEEEIALLKSLAPPDTVKRMQYTVPFPWAVPPKVWTIEAMTWNSSTQKATITTLERMR